MLTDKQLAIIKLLANKPSKTVEEISNSLNMSTRTVKRYIDYINDEYGEKLSIVLKRGVGYEIQGDEEAIQRVILNSINDSDPNIRMVTLMLMLADENEITAEELSEKLNVSVSTLTKCIPELKNELNKYDLKISFRSHHGYKLEGNEFNIRAMMMDKGFYYHNSTLTGTRIINLMPEEYDLIEETTYEILKKNSVVIADRDMANLLMRITISFSRSRSCKKMSAIDINEKLKQHNYQTVFEIMKSIADKLSIDLDATEYNYVSVYSGFMLYRFEVNDIFVEDEVIAFSKKMLDMISDLSGINYASQKDILKAFSIHLKIMLHRLQNNNASQNPLIETIKKDYPLEMNYAIQIAKEIQSTYHVVVNEEEIGYLAVHLATYSLKTEKKQRAVILCNYGLGTSQLIKERINDEIKDLEIIGIFPVHYLELALTQDVDYIISTIPIQNYTGAKPLIVIENVLSINAIQRLKEQSSKLVKHAHSFDQYFKEDCFFKLNCTTKEETMNVLCNHLKNERGFTEEIINSIYEREAMSSTDVGNYIAIPHTLSEGNFQSVVSIAILDQAIQWNNEKVKIVFLICLNKNDSENITIFKDLYRVFSSTASVDKLMNSQSFSEFIEVIERELTKC